MTWFSVDKTGLAATLERRGKSFALFELVQNAWDSAAKNIDIALEPIPGQPYARIEVEDDGEGFADLAHAHTLFARSTRGGLAGKRGRFNLGEKLVLSICRTAEISTRGGSLEFRDDGSVRKRADSFPGTRFVAAIRMTREELAEVTTDSLRLIGPAGTTTTFNGREIERPTPLKVIEAKLPTEIADADGNLRRSVRQAFIEIFAGNDGGEILEMGIPVCAADFPWRLNVQQKIPLGMERDSVTDAFRRALTVATTNAMADSIDAEQAAEPWAAEVIADSRVSPDALKDHHGAIRGAGCRCHAGRSDGERDSRGDGLRRDPRRIIERRRVGEHAEASDAPDDLAGVPDGQASLYAH
jgi:hypothetical protein